MDVPPPPADEDEEPSDTHVDLVKFIGDRNGKLGQLPGETKQEADELWSSDEFDRYLDAGRDSISIDVGRDVVSAGTNSTLPAQTHQ